MKMNRIIQVAGLLAVVAVVALACSQGGMVAKTTTPETSPAVQKQAAQVQVQAPAKHEEVDFSMSCLECHQEVTPEETDVWYASRHGKVNIGCFICHGDGEEEFYAKPTTDACTACHSRVEMDFAKAEASTCFSCHNGHSLKFHMVLESEG